MVFRLILAEIILLAGLYMAAAQGEVVQGRSRELGIEFKLVGDTHWCNRTVGVQLNARRASTYNLNNKSFVRALGRVRAIIQDECRTVERIEFEGRVNQRLVFAAEISRLLGWRRYVGLKPKSREPYCPPPLKPGIECSKRIAAYVMANRIMHGDAFAHTELTTVLNGLGDEYLVWRSPSIVGKLRIEKREQFPGFSNGAQLAEAIVANIAEDCTSSGGHEQLHDNLDYASGLAQRGVTCIRTNVLSEQNVILVLTSDGNFDVFSIWSDAAPNAARDSAKNLWEAIRQSSQFMPKSMSPTTTDR